MYTNVKRERQFVIYLVDRQLCEEYNFTTAEVSDDEVHNETIEIKKKNPTQVHNDLKCKTSFIVDRIFFYVEMAWLHMKIL